MIGFGVSTRSRKDLTIWEEKLKTLSLIIGLIFAAGIQAAETQSESKALYAKTLTVTSFNIRYYGRTDRPDEVPVPAERNPHIKSFLQNEVPFSDVIVFEEIMDKQELKNVLPSNMDCLSYDNDNPNHQFVVMCARSQYKWKIDTATDDNYTIEEVALGSSGMRPALHALLTDSKGKVLLRIVGVHLKAFPTRSDVRALQMEYISKQLASADERIPTIITGDFNTYYPDQTGLSKPDTELLTDQLVLQNLDIGMANHPSDYTFRSGVFRSKFDHFWKSRDLKAIGDVQVTGYCNDATKQPKSLSVDDYLRFISDHCPVSLKVRIP